MQTTAAPRSSRELHPGLAVLTLASFIASFLAARAFTTIFPTTVVNTGGIHFHHFWYGLAMLVSAGWLSIVSSHHHFDRAYAIIFGLGAGLVGDEVGLLLTLGDYKSELTYVFFVVVLATAGICYLLFRFWNVLWRDLTSHGPGRAMAEVGLLVAGLSAIAFAFDYEAAGLAILVVGFLIILIGYGVRRSRSRAKPAERLSVP